MAHPTFLLQHEIPSPAKRSRISLMLNHQLESNLLPLQPSSLLPSDHLKSKQQDLTYKDNNKENLATLPNGNTSLNSLCVLQSSQSSIHLPENRMQKESVSGLPNCGNTCYVNSVLQVLRYTPKFLNCLQLLLASYENLAQISSSEKTREEELFMRLDKLYSAMKKREMLLTECSNDCGSLLRPVQSFLKCLRGISPTFEKGYQHDAHEFLLSMISAFDLLKQNLIIKAQNSFTNECISVCTVLNMEVSKIPVDICQSKGSKNLKRQKLWNLLPTLSMSMLPFKNIEHLDLGFEGQICQAIKCLECENVSKRFDMFSNLEVAIADNLLNEGMVNLRECLIQKSKLFGADKYFCANCCHSNEANVYSRVVSLPSILLIHVSWLKQSSDITSNEKDYMKFLIPLSLKTAENDEIFECSQDAVYNLYAVVLHLGCSSEEGHYISFIKETAPNENDLEPHFKFQYASNTASRWLLFNDENVTAVGIELLDIFPYFEYLDILASPYMIFYQKTNF